MLMIFYCCQNGSFREEDLFLLLLDVYYGIVEEFVIIIYFFYGGIDFNGLIKILQEIQFRYVVLYDVDMQFVRELEVKIIFRSFSFLNQRRVVQFFELVLGCLVF